jgi:hypothetical protein
MKNGPTEMPVELVMATLLRTIPVCIRIVRDEGVDSSVIPDATLANITAGVVLFLLGDYLPMQLEEKTETIQRAFDSAWSLIDQIGGDEEGARAWFETISVGLLASPWPPDRVALSIAQLKSYFPGKCEGESALDILVYSVSNGMKRTIPFLRIT